MNGDSGTDSGGLSMTPPPGATWTTAEFTASQSVPADQELFMCQVVTLPQVTGWMVQGEHNYTPGSHHLLLYTTDLTTATIPAGSETVSPCYEGGNASNNLMSHITGVLYGGQTPTGSEAFPPGIGLPTTANQVLIFQVHYLNATATTLDANVDVKLWLDSGNDIKTNAGVLFFYDPFIDVPAGGMSKAQMRCPITSDITLLSAQSHYHARGVNYGAYVDTAKTTLGTTPFYTSDSWTSPPLATMMMPISAGSFVRFECDYDNTEPTPDGPSTVPYYQGQSAFTNEMCLFIGTYYPDMGAATDTCQTSPDMFGTGTTSCTDTLNCLAACPNPGQITSDCAQGCMVNSCPAAFDSLDPALTCIEKNCKTQCAGGSQACTSCVTSSCASQYGACLSAPCTY